MRAANEEAGRAWEPRVLVVGVGGLGAPALLALAARGVRRLGLLEPDRVELSSLHRQILYREADVGAPKAECARRALASRFPGLELAFEVCAFEASTHDLVAAYDVVLDGTDGFETKLALADACLDRGVPFVFAGVVGHEGQVLPVLPGRSACPRCLFEEAPPPGAAPTCAEIGILGPIAGIVAAKQVDVALALVDARAGGPIPASLLDTLWVYDGRGDRARQVRIARDPACRGCGANRHLRGVAPTTIEDARDLGADAPVVDLSGQVCPNTYILTRRALEALPEGARLWVELTSDEAARSVPRSALAAGHRVLAHKTDGRLHRILFARGPTAMLSRDGREPKREDDDEPALDAVLRTRI